MTRIIAFTGVSATGKTTIAIQLAREFGYAYLGTGQMFEEFAIQHGYANARALFKKEGRRKPFEIARQFFWQRIHAAAGKGLVFDGLYDPMIMEKMVRSFGRENISVINLTAAKAMRKYFAKKRALFSGKKTRKETRKREANKWAAGMREVISHADFSIKAIGPLGKTMEELRKRFRRL